MNNYLPISIKTLNESKFIKIWIVFLTISVIAFIVRYPGEYSRIETTMFLDVGAVLKVDELISKGYSPTVDFVYLYGLIPLAIGKFWLGIFGRNPQAIFGFGLFSYIFSTAALARISVISNLKLLGIIFLGISITFFTFVQHYWTFTSPLESVLILWALATHLSGKKGHALVFLTIGAFTKPSMSVLYGLVILLIYLYDLIGKRTTVGQVLRELRPAAFTLGFILTFLTVSFGFPTVISSFLSPLQGRLHYKAMNYGIFGVGSMFFHNPTNNFSFRFYIGPVSVWIISTFSLLVFTILSIFKHDEFNNRQILEVQTTIIILHLTFIFCFFSGWWAWTYYSYLLAVGIALLVSKDINYNRYKSDFLVIILTLVLLLNHYPNLVSSYSSWQNFRGSSFSPFVNSYLDYDQELETADKYCKTRNTLIFGSSAGGGGILLPECKTPDAWWLLKGPSNQKEIARVNKQISESEIIVLVKDFDMFDLSGEPTFKDQLSKFKTFEKGKHFEFMNRK